MPANKSQVRFLFTLLAIVWGFLVGANSLLAEWSTPTAVPPGNNPDPFLSTNSNSQTKTGVLTISNNFYVIGSGPNGKVGIGTSTNDLSARLMVEPYTDASIDAGTGYIRTNYYATFGTDVVNKNYLMSAMDLARYWILSGSNLYASSTAYNVAIGTTTAGTAKLAVVGGNVGIGTTNPGAKLEVSGGILSKYTKSGRETFFTAYPADVSTTRFDIFNGTNVDGNFTPGFQGYRTGAGNNIANLTFYGKVNADADTGTNPLIRFVGGRILGDPIDGTNSVVTTRPIAQFLNYNQELMTILANGNVGIGTTSPTVSLHINGHAIADTPIDPQHLATKSYVDTAAQSLWINNGSFLYTSSTSWRVGIGTTSPASALHIYPQNNIEGLRVVSSNYSPLVIMSSSSNALFRVDEIGRTRSSAYCDIDGSNCFNPNSGWSTDSYLVTTTPTTYNGNRGGYVAANALCNAIISGSHVCTTGEILDTINAGFASRIPIGAGNAFWFSSGPPGYTVNANDCIGFTSNSAGDFGTIWTRTSSDNQGAGGLNSCNDSKKIACCK